MPTISDSLNLNTHLINLHARYLLDELKLYDLMRAVTVHHARTPFTVNHAHNWNCKQQSDPRHMHVFYSQIHESLSALERGMLGSGLFCL